MAVAVAVALPTPAPFSSAATEMVASPLADTIERHHGASSAVAVVSGRRRGPAALLLVTATSLWRTDSLCFLFAGNKEKKNLFETAAEQLSRGSEREQGTLSSWQWLVIGELPGGNQSPGIGPPARGARALFRVCRKRPVSGRRRRRRRRPVPPGSPSRLPPAGTASIFPLLPLEPVGLYQIAICLEVLSEII